MYLAGRGQPRNVDIDGVLLMSLFWGSGGSENGKRDQWGPAFFVTELGHHTHATTFLWAAMTGFDTRLPQTLSL
jgi:hypothetical protein